MFLYLFGYIIVQPEPMCIPGIQTEKVTLPFEDKVQLVNLEVEQPVMGNIIGTSLVSLLLDMVELPDVNHLVNQDFLYFLIRESVPLTEGNNMYLSCLQRFLAMLRISCRKRKGMQGEIHILGRWDVVIEQHTPILPVILLYLFEFLSFHMLKSNFCMIGFFFQNVAPSPKISSPMRE